MNYECERCTALLPPGARACPMCGDPFDEPVPADAEIPTTVLSQQVVPVRTPLWANSHLRIVFPLVLILACGSYAAFLDKNAEHGSLTRSTINRTVSTQHLVTYTVTGTAPTVDITYRDGTGSRQQIDAVPLPWSQTLRMAAGSFMYLSAQNRSEDGDVMTEINVDGARRAKSDEQGGFSISVVDDSL